MLEPTLTFKKDAKTGWMLSKQGEVTFVADGEQNIVQGSETRFIKKVIMHSSAQVHGDLELAGRLQFTDGQLGSTGSDLVWTANGTEINMVKTHDSVVGLTSSVATLNTDMAKTGNRLDQLSDMLAANVAELNGSITDISGQMAGLNVQTAGLNGSITDLNVQMTGLTSDVAGLNGSITDISGQMAGLTSDVAGLNGQMAVINERLATLDNAPRSDNIMQPASDAVDCYRLVLNNYESPPVVLKTNASGLVQVTDGVETRLATENDLRTAVQDCVKTDVGGRRVTYCASRTYNGVDLAVGDVVGLKNSNVERVTGWNWLQLSELKNTVLASKIISSSIYMVVLDDLTQVVSLIKYTVDGNVVPVAGCKLDEIYKQHCTIAHHENCLIVVAWTGEQELTIYGITDDSISLTCWDKAVYKTASIEKFSSLYDVGSHLFTVVWQSTDSQMSVCLFDVSGKIEAGSVVEKSFGHSTQGEIIMQPIPGNSILVGYGNCKMAIMLPAHCTEPVWLSDVVVDNDIVDTVDMIYDQNNQVVISLDKTIIGTYYIKIIDCFGSTVAVQKSKHVRNFGYEPVALSYNSAKDQFVLWTYKAGIHAHYFTNDCDSIDLLARVGNGAVGSDGATNTVGCPANFNVVFTGIFMLIVGKQIWTLNDNFGVGPSAHLGMVLSINTDWTVEVVMKGQVFQGPELPLAWVGKKVYIDSSVLGSQVKYPANITTKPFGNIWLGTVISADSILIGL